jgi:tetratricopeptide (TPR) repeat protein
VYHPIRVFGVTLALVMAAPMALAQKPSGPAPGPAPQPSPGRGAASTSNLPSTQPDPTVDQMVMFIRGRVAISDGTPVPHDLLVERVCNSSVIQQIYPAPSGDFSMQLGSMSQTVVDATGDLTPRFGTTNKNSEMGIPRRELQNCDIRVSASGFRSDSISLVALTPSIGAIDVGNISVQRTTKVEGMTLSAAPYKAPKDALKAYEKGMAATKKDKFDEASQHFAQAVKIYPKYTVAWFQLGLAYQKQKQVEEARAAFLQSTTIDTKFLPPYLSLASMAFEEQNWKDALTFTNHILDLDPLNHTNVTGYILDLDPLNCTEAYFYNAVANYKLKHIDQAEKSALKAEHVDLMTHFPQLHVLLAEIFAQKNNYPGAITELQMYLDLVPNAKQDDYLRQKLAKLEQLNDAASNGGKTDQ